MPREVVVKAISSLAHQDSPVGESSSYMLDEFVATMLSFI